MSIEANKLTHKQKLLFATDQGCTYETSKTSLEKSWDALSLYYQSEIDKIYKEHFLDKNLFTKIQESKIELETLKTTHDLITQNVIKEVKVSKRDESTAEEATGCIYTLRKKMLGDCRNIIKDKLVKLQREAIREGLIWERVSNMHCQMADYKLKIFVEGNINEDFNIYRGVEDEINECKEKIVDRRYFVYLKGDDFVCRDEFMPVGLSCTIEYKGFKLKGRVDKNISEDAFHKIKEYLVEKDLEGEYKNKHVRISVKRTREEEFKEMAGREDSFCVFAIMQMKKGCHVLLINEMFICYASKLFLKCFLKSAGLSELEIIQGTGQEMTDGLSETFFCISNMGVIKVKRSLSNFSLFINEKPIEIEKR